MQETNGNITEDNLEQHQNGSYNVFIRANAIDFSTRIVGSPVCQGDNKRVYACYGEEYPRYLVPKRQLVVVIFGFSVNGAFALFDVLVVGRQSNDIGFRLEPTWPEASRIVFDSRATTVVSGDEHGNQEMCGNKHEDPVAKIQEPVVAISETTVDQPGQEVKASEKTVNEKERKGQPLQDGDKKNKGKNSRYNR